MLLLSPCVDAKDDDLIMSPPSGTASRVYSSNTRSLRNGRSTRESGKYKRVANVAASRSSTALGTSPALLRFP
jgi:hypothetical protein